MKNIILCLMILISFPIFSNEDEYLTDYEIINEALDQRGYTGHSNLTLLRPSEVIGGQGMIGWASRALLYIGDASGTSYGIRFELRGIQIECLASLRRMVITSIARYEISSCSSEDGSQRIPMIRNRVDTARNSYGDKYAIPNDGTNHENNSQSLNE